MQAIDHYAWTNRWRNRHPLEKLLPALTLLLLTLVLPPLRIGPLALAGTTLATVGGAGIPLKTVWACWPRRRRFCSPAFRFWRFR